MAKYNGWKNYETWNAALWIGNDEGLYLLARTIRGCNKRTPYGAFVAEMQENGTPTTRDGIAWDDKRISRRELNSMMREL